jgi:mono/diheme cytochrome c family protein
MTRNSEPSGSIAVKIPQLSDQAMAGKEAFDDTCASCHGTGGSGTTKGPPLIHDIYNPGHHSDMAFVLAAKNGVRRHHWSYGNMPPQPHVSEQEIEKIITYIREIQRANGITYKEHKM